MHKAVPTGRAEDRTEPAGTVREALLLYQEYSHWPGPRKIASSPSTPHSYDWKIPALVIHRHRQRTTQAMGMRNTTSVRAPAIADESCYEAFRDSEAAHKRCGRESTVLGGPDAFEAISLEGMLKRVVDLCCPELTVRRAYTALNSVREWILPNRRRANGCVAPPTVRGSATSAIDLQALPSPCWKPDLSSVISTRVELWLPAVDRDRPTSGRSSAKAPTVSLAVNISRSPG